MAESRPPDLAGALSKELAALVPDVPQWIDLEGLLYTGRCDVWAEEDPARGFVALSWDFPFASLFGEPRRDLVRSAVDAGLAACEGRYRVEEWQLLAAPEARALVESALPGWQRRGIVLHRLAGELETAEPDSPIEIRLLPEGLGKSELTIDGFPPASRFELELDWVSRRPMAAACVGSNLVAYCWAAFTTPSLWDVAIETSKPYRCRGLAAACFLTLAPYMAEQGKSPAWGADLDNPASLGLAAKLGFVHDAALDGWFRSR